jgi:ABC-type lipoprotein release transport system permease subunit
VAIVVVGVVASLVPTWRAATVDVVEGFRHLG